MYVVLKKEKGLESSTENVHRSLVQNKLGFLLTLQKLFNSLIYSANSNSYFFSHLSNYKWSLVFTGVCGSALLCMGVCRCVCVSLQVYAGMHGCELGMGRCVWDENSKYIPSGD